LLSSETKEFLVDMIRVEQMQPVIEAALASQAERVYPG
jgi:hypothetical protein